MKVIIHIAAQVHGRVLVQEASASPAPLLVCFHGYGENAEQFLETVTAIRDVSKWHVAVIQALHPFYDRKTRSVVASWMTKQDRDHAITDNVAYVTKAVETVRRQLGVKSPTAFLGFSQGTAMAYRSAYLTNQQCDGLIALAGDAPVEIETSAINRVPSILIGRGSADTWYDEQKLKNDVTRLTRMGSSVEVCVFEGGHTWTDSFRTVAGAFLEKLRHSG